MTTASSHSQDAVTPFGRGEGQGGDMATMRTLALWGILDARNLRPEIDFITQSDRKGALSVTVGQHRAIIVISKLWGI